MSELTCWAPWSPLSTSGCGRRTDANSLRTNPRISPSTSFAGAASSADRLALMTFMLVPVRSRYAHATLSSPAGRDHAGDYDEMTAELGHVRGIPGTCFARCREANTTGRGRSVPFSGRYIGPQRRDFFRRQQVTPRRHLVLATRDRGDEARPLAMGKFAQIERAFRILHARAVTGRAVARVDGAAEINLLRRKCFLGPPGPAGEEDRYGRSNGDHTHSKPM